MTSQGALHPTSDDWATIRDLLDRLIDRSSDDRRRILSGLSLAAPLRREVETLLAAADAAGDFMETAPGIVVEPDIREYRSLPPASRVGVFRVERLIGRGGHGEVYEAFRDDGQFDQRVALKLLRPEALSQFEAFRNERQVLAGLDHAGVARLIDGGIAPDGRPYMAMEFVEGVAIDDHCRDEGCDVATVLKMVLRLCDAVTHAHGNLVVHGDIKPGNVLVDAAGQPRLLDFGIARMMETDTAMSGLTAALSTPAYAAPEQLAGKRATIATDVYALGVLLYELLSGRAPWQMGEGPISWASRLLRDEPPSASTRAPPDRRTLIRGDLDAIVAKAMRADPAMRYETVPALADDIRRHLDRRPVLARNGTALYRVRRFARRNALGLAAAVLVAATGAAGLGATLSTMREAEAGRASARAEAGRVDTLRSYMDLLFRASAGEIGSGLTSRRILDATAAQLQRDAAGGNVAPELLRLMGELYVELEEFGAAERFLEQYAAIAQQGADAAGLAHARQLLAVAAIRRGDLDTGEALLDLADSVWSAEPRRFVRERAQQKAVRAALLRQRGRTEAALALLGEAIEEAGEALGATSIDVLTMRQNLATHLLEARRIEEARSQFDALEGELDAQGRATSPTGLAVTMHQALLALQDGDTEKADRLLSQAVEARRGIYGESEALAALQLNHARILLTAGQAGRARALLDEALGMSLRAAGNGGMIYVMLLQSRGLAHLALGDPTAARSDVDAALATAEENFGPRSVIAASALAASANVALIEGLPELARERLGRAHDILAGLGPVGAHQLRVVEALEEMAREVEQDAQDP